MFLPVVLTQNVMLGCFFLSLIMQYCWSHSKTNVLMRWRGVDKESKNVPMLYLASRKSDQSFS